MDNVECHPTEKNNITDNKLDLSDQDLTTLTIQQLEAISILTEVYLDYNSIEYLPDDIGKLANVKILSCIGNQLTGLPDSIGDLSVLEELFLNENDITHLPVSFTKLSRLKMLNIIGNCLEMLPANFGDLTSLEVFKADENFLQAIPNSMGRLVHLKILELSSNGLCALPDNFGGLQDLTILNLNDNKLNNLPASFSELESLTNIDLSNNSLEFLPNTMKCAMKIETLYVNSNEIKQLPNWIQNLCSVVNLQLKDNKLQKRPLSLEFGLNSKQLKILNMSGNFISHLPETFGELVNLEFIHFGSIIHELERRNFQNGNWIHHLPDSFCQLTRLKECRFEENQLRELPENFGNLKSLEFLDLGQNQLCTLPDSFGKLSRLETCLLSKNHIRSLPNSFGQLSNLLDLRLDNNTIENLPDSLNKLTQLKTLDLFYNCLTEVPRCLQYMNNLIRLDLDQNKLGLKNRDIPMMIKGLKYAPRDSSMKNNWRGRERDDHKTFSVIEIPSSGLPDDEEIPEPSVVDTAIYERAVRQNLSLWKSHTDKTEKREVFVQHQIPSNNEMSDEDCSDSEWVPAHTGHIQKDAMNIVGKLKIRELIPSDNTDKENSLNDSGEDWESETLDVSPGDFQLQRYSHQKKTVVNNHNDDPHTFVPTDVHALPCQETVINFTIEDGQFSDAED